MAKSATEALQFAQIQQTSSVIVVVAQTIQLLAQMPTLMSQMVFFKDQKPIVVLVKDKGLSDIKEILENSFLGMGCTYFIWDIEQCHMTIATQLMHYLGTYRGPHRVYLFCHEAASCIAMWKGPSIYLPHEMSVSYFNKFCLSWFVAHGLHKQIAPLVIKEGSIALYEVALLLPYAPLLGKTLLVPFREQYVPRIIRAENKSLFNLLDAWWQKKGSLFYALWRTMHNLYSEQFWIVFWSDQLFRGYMYAYCMRQKSELIAQKIAARKLPFLYTKTGWRIQSLAAVQKIHGMFYALDYTSKTGGSGLMLEWIYAAWFNDCV